MCNAQVRSLAIENVLRSSSLLLATALCTLIVLSSSLIVAHPIKHRAFIHARAGERLAFISSHMLAQPFHSSFITIALARKRLAFSTLKLENVLRSLRYHRAARRCSCATCRERFAWVTLNYMQYAPLLENALRSSSLVQSCNSLALIVALACNRPHRPSSSLILSSIVRSSTIHPR